MPAHTHGSTLALVLALPLVACAQDGAVPPEQQESASAEVERLASELAPSMPAFGDRGHRSLGLTFEGAHSNDAVSFGPRVALHYFLADRFEIHASLAVWGHNQDGTDAYSLNPSLGFRYHLIEREAFSLYADIGVGLLFSNEEVPDGGTRTNFTPRAGFGATFPIGDEGARLDFGVRWHHISNASTSGIDDNPDRDGIGVYAGVMIPF